MAVDAHPGLDSRRSPPSDLDIEETHKTLARLETATWGIALREVDGERFVVVPAGALADPPLTVGARPAVKLSKG